MGACESSTKNVVDPMTGEVKQKKKLGGAHPGNRRVAQPVYQPNDNEYTQINSTTAVANAHFVTCPGGNALKLVGKPNRAEEQSAIGGNAKYISVTLPPGVQSGDVIHVRAPDGALNAITVPAGMGPGSTFTVEFSRDATPANEEELTPGLFVPTVTAEPEVGYSGSGAFASGVAGGGGTEAVANATTGPYVPAVYASHDSKY